MKQNLVSKLFWYRLQKNWTREQSLFFSVMVLMQPESLFEAIEWSLNVQWRGQDIWFLLDWFQNWSCRFWNLSSSYLWKGELLTCLICTWVCPYAKLFKLKSIWLHLEHTVFKSDYDYHKHIYLDMQAPNTSRDLWVRRELWVHRPLPLWTLSSPPNRSGVFSSPL